MSGRQLTPSEQVQVIRGLARVGERAKADEFMGGYFFFVDDDNEANWLRSLMATPDIIPIEQRNPGASVASVRVEEFHAHLDVCEQCREHPMNLCATGAKILKMAVT